MANKTSPVITYEPDKRGKFRWAIESGNNRIVGASSQGFTRVYEARRNAIKVRDDLIYLYGLPKKLEVVPKEQLTAVVNERNDWASKANAKQANLDTCNKKLQELCDQERKTNGLLQATENRYQRLAKQLPTTRWQWLKGFFSGRKFTF